MRTASSVPNSSTESNVAASGTSNEVRPEELSELVERLHARPERLTTADVAETLGVTESEVADALAAVRSSQVVPLSSIGTSPKRHRFSGWRILGGVVLAGALFGTGFLLYGEGYSAGKFRMSRQIDSTPPRPVYATRVPEPGGVRVDPSEAGERLMKALPVGMTIKIGENVYQGKDRGEVFAHGAAMKAIEDLSHLLGTPASMEGKVDRQAILKELGTSHPVAVTGVGFVEIRSSRNSTGFIDYIPNGPGPAISFGDGTEVQIRKARAKALATLSEKLKQLGRYAKS